MGKPCEAGSTAETLSLRTLQRRARASGQVRFSWDEAKDQTLRALWLQTDIDGLSGLLGCSARSIYKRAGELGLAARDPVKRMIASGIMPRDPLALPTFDELRARATPAAFAAPPRPETARSGRGAPAEVSA